MYPQCIMVGSRLRIKNNARVLWNIFKIFQRTLAWSPILRQKPIIVLYGYIQQLLRVSIWKPKQTGIIH